LATYNEALAAVAAGQNSQQAQQAVEGFVGALKNFPFDEVAALGSAATPYTAVAAKVVEWVQKEYQARKFKQAVLVAAPEMRKFHAACRADASLMYDARIALLRESYAGASRDLLNLRSRFKGVVDAHSWATPDAINRQIANVNALAAISSDVVLFPPIPTVAAPAGAGGPPAATASELLFAQNFAAQAASKVEPIREILRQAKAYRNLMDQYAELLKQFESSQQQLVDAVEKNSKQLPSIEQLKAVISNVRMAREIYLSAK
jgi:hypothetical protein